MCTTDAALITGGILQGTAGFIGAQQEAASDEFKSEVALNEARMLDIQAGDVATQGAAQATRARQATSAAVASQVASTAGAGIDVGGATARELFESTEAIGVADELEIRSNTKKSIWALRETGKVRRAEAKALKKSAKITRFVAPIAFAAPILIAKGRVGILEKERTQ